MNRRELLQRLSALVTVRLKPDATYTQPFRRGGPCEPAPLGDLVRVVPFVNTREYQTPLGRLVGGPGLDARMFTDLSTLAPDRLITPADRVFIRTAAPAAAARAREWTIAVKGLDGRTTIALAELLTAARPMGAHLIECSGNSDPQNFGLMSVAEWDGVPLVDVIRRMRPGPTAAAVCVAGMDHDNQLSTRSLPGASWIVPLDSLERVGPFLAVRMNGRPLPLDHGAPVRLVVPGWYGCAWIKWVNEIRFVDRDERATPQMREFAARTHQRGVPELAREFEAPAIDLAATPIRIEQRRVNGRLEYRIVGIVWGGDKPVDRLRIRFSADGQAVPFEICPPQKTNKMWSLWEYRWRPERPGTYHITLHAVDPAVRTRRLDLSFYVRTVRIDEI